MILFQKYKILLLHHELPTLEFMDFEKNNEQQV